MEALLSVRDLSLRFGGIVALNKVSFDVKAGSITAIIGPNGAGKTTLFNCITGFYRAQEGSILFRSEGGTRNVVEMLGGISGRASLGKRIVGGVYRFFGGTHLVARAGIARTFQNIRLFGEMSVLENLLVAQHMHVNRNLFSGFFKLPSFRQAEAEALKQAYHWLDIVGLRAQANSIAGSLSYGNQRRLEIARAMCTRPKMICLDEPAAGLNPRETAELADLIKRLRQELTVLVIEHDMSLVMKISDHVVVLNYGEVIASADPETVQADPKVLAAYLGTEEDE